MARKRTDAEENDTEPIDIPAPDDENFCAECDGEECEDCDFEGVEKDNTIKELDEF